MSARTCTVCRQEIPDAKLDCPRCAAEKSYRAILDYQKQFVHRILRGECTLVFRKPGRDPHWHMLFPQYQQAWCGAEIDSQWAKKRLRYPQLDDRLLPLCSACREAFETTVKEA